MKFSPKKENENVGFFYHVSEEQLDERRKMTVKEILQWLEDGAKFLYAIQTPEERDRVKRAINFKWNEEDIAALRDIS
jgi:hypothetical protein